MDLLRNMNRALHYIEENLTNDIDFREVARLALCSEYHFKRMFSFLAGITLSEYIRRRRLTLAAFELKDSNIKVIDVAIKYNYSSPDSFTRAFQNLHGITPSEAKKNGSSLKAFPKMTFQLSIKGGNEMNYRIEEKEAFHIVGIKERVPIIFHGVNPKIAAMWESLNDETVRKLKELSNVTPLGLLSASLNFSEGRMEEKGQLDHYIGVATTKDCPDDLVQLEVPAGIWAVFEAVGPFPETLQNVWGRIYSEWFPSSNYEQVEGPEILWNEHKNVTSPTFKSEIWIPVLKK
ncbi:AraC family transcriptional regulator [Priestia megaterium]|jgi:AraC family transcriptional regulator|uniref:Helix-turn-helix domain protein n=1 Tax=Priestia megaterium (strain ATCC 14581 / DSM 32 / CCUG 1817 / JCM 2506 / NBRC 15308 / NCIMB 9376 / NCTC 10342 / NRRL B-14308 / VKM B-512 / Ford 19) TaxID=1348623 RepID=A0A0B6AAY4_PRIM2|nr:MULTISPECIES: AraC family transcriptional regulator [Priestia]AJI22095.1 helix-turn-helix domain protein [Priestia megaterium NBRC 15308 = ATCC 14581]KFN06131.1 helix-turn-helix domain protein [Priestia megaterium]KGJ82468.1 AraC family transcriptional regulator [Priestia megaterium NBRC 15308 = ATCC 14581]MCR8927675.1 AraC family transcriptional regulator [Priestia megaterium]MCU7707662.1 AraC family transcriptional regulator [Priestia megaterium]